MHTIIKPNKQFTAERWMEQLDGHASPRKSLFALAALGLTALTLAGCGPDFSGRKDNFEIQGVVKTVGQRSVTINIMRVIEANGKSRGRYLTDEGEPEIGKQTQVHDNFQNESCSEEPVGDEYSYEGEEINVRNFKVGDYVDIMGNIRSSKYKCGKHPAYDERPVYEELRKISVNQLGRDFKPVNPERTDLPG